MALLTTTEREQVVAAVREVEQHSATELVVAVLARSARYGVRRIVLAGLFTVFTVLAIHDLWPSVPTLWLMLSQIPLVLGFYLGCRGALLRWLIPRGVQRERVQARAFRLFAERGIHNTKDHTGVLIFVSELEHQAVILADRGIDAWVGAEGWKQAVDQLVAGIRAGNAAATLVSVIREMGGVLTEHFPRQDDDENELPDEVLTK